MKFAHKRKQGRASRDPVRLHETLRPYKTLPLPALAALLCGLLFRLGLRLLSLLLRSSLLLRRLFLRFGFRFGRGFPSRGSRGFHALVLLLRLFLDDHFLRLFDDIAARLSFFFVVELQKLLVFFAVHLRVEHFVLRRVLNSSPHLIGLSEFCQAAATDRRNSKRGW